MASADLQKCQNSNDTALNICTNGLIQDILKCFFCEKILSVPPIYNHEFESICGRCKFVDKSEDFKWTRQVIYENIAKFMIFPCSNVTYGCKVQLKWGEVEEHENTCLYKKLNCPFINDDIFSHEKCKWMGSGPSLNKHLESCHGDLIKKIPEINFTECKTNCIFLTRILKQLMIVTIRFQPPEKYSCGIMVNGTSTDCGIYRYQLELYDEDRKNVIILRRNRLEDAVGFDENINNSEKNLEIVLSVIGNLLKNPQTIMGRFGIIKKSKRELFQGDGRSHNSSDVFFDENFLKELECPVCKNYMVPPIAICIMGHSFCHDCKEQMDVCPNCRYPFEDARNYTLEKLTSCINYPCVNRDAGCPVTCPGLKLKEHEVECSFSGSKCFLNCSSKCIMNMFQHLNEKHPNALVVEGELNIIHVGDDDVTIKYFAICYGNDIFRLVVLCDDDIKFSLQQFGVGQSYYNFEVEIIYAPENSEKIILAKRCPPFGTELWKKSVYLPEDLMQRFISEDNLVFFKVYLKKMI